MRLALLLALWLCTLAAPALAADPIMPLDQVQRGMECEGRTVLRGTAIETFDVEILDVLESAPGRGLPAILFRASGPAIDGTGMGFGFSGSPIYCPDSAGTLRNAGAVAAGIDDYGNDTALATPIEAILSRPVAAPPQARPATESEMRARPWSGPLTVAGTGPTVSLALRAAAARQGVQLIHAPATSAQVTTGTDLQPGSAVAAAVSSGAIGLNAIGTVAYRNDSGRIWAFGHPFEGAGTRSLLMQGAFVHQIVANPNPPGINLGTYKLASAGDPAGTIDFDGIFAVSGTLGALPATIPVVVRATGPGGQLPASRTAVADESPLNHPSGFATLSLVSSIAVSDRVLRALGSNAGRSYGRMCLRIDIEERDAPMRFCNRYIGDGQVLGGTEIAMGADASSAGSLVERFDRRQLHVERVRATLDVNEGLRFARLRGARGPKRISPGERVRITIRYQLPREEVQESTFTMRMPETLRRGRRTLRLTGSQADPGDASLEALFTAGFPGPEGDLAGPDRPPTTIAQLAKRIAKIHRYDGIRATFKRQPGSEGGEEEDELADLLGLTDPAEAEGKPVFRHDELRIGGSARIRFRVVPGG